MDGGTMSSIVEGSVIRRVEAAVGSPLAATDYFRAGFGAVRFSMIVVFASPDANASEIVVGLSRAYPEAEVIGCTTAGEIARDGYVDDRLVAIGFPGAFFDAELVTIDSLETIDEPAVAAALMDARARQQRRRSEWSTEFGFMLIDGLSQREDLVAGVVRAGMGGAPFFGGSAGDGLSFGETMLFHNRQTRRNAAIVACVRSRCPVRVFKLDHLVPTERKMVVTRADHAGRVVRELNAEPAAKEYARILGKDPEQLSPFTFAAHPLLVKIGDQHHVRSIRQVLPNGDLAFFSAIDEGLVLTLAEPTDIVRHLDESLQGLRRRGAPAAIIACDCILRRPEAEQRQASAAVSRVLSSHGVVGFSTYGEQYNGAHVNQTLTGIAIYPPAAACGA